jgi:hypothetical protein
MRMRSQNKDFIIDATVIRVKVTKKKTVIGVRYVGDAWNMDSWDGFMEIGEYQDEYTAMKEMDSIMEFFSENPSGIYQVK